MARYELVERIGVGGMAEIFRGKAIASGGFEKPVAIKRILPHLSQDKRFVALLIAEAKTLSQLRHRNIVQIYDVGLGDDGQYFLVMEYVDGIDLGALYESLEKRSRRLPIDVALHVAAEVCEALDHAHRARGADGEPLGLVHRDVSPSNVLLSRSGEVKLTDFGIAKRTEEATGHGGVRGKFAYISPEQAHNIHVDARSDVYSVGVVLYELITGRRLYSGMPDFDALRAVREGRTPQPREADPGISPELESMLKRALAPRPEDRFPSAGNFGAELRGFRYSLVSTASDPAVEISRMIEEQRARSSGDRAASREPTFVRIASVAGFSGSFEVPEESTGGGVTGEVTRAASERLDALEEEETHAVRLRDAPALRTPTGLALDELETRVDDRVRRPGSGPTGEFDLSDAETSVVDYQRPRGLLERPLPGVSGATRLPSSDAHALASGSEPSLAAVPEATEREATPTVRQMFRAGGLLEREPAPAASPILDARALAARRRVILAAAGAAVVLAIVAFVIAGAMGGGESSAAARVPD
ncbi:MAG TPA: serine/threonine-protein kinase, partial [Kofleriaceae bacterium]|nr:serine/threonine-protein kinase [Kofleriaceae bacterium]